jgi:hypothetical protein
MSMQSRLARLEQSMRPSIQDRESPCNECGAPESTIMYKGLHFIMVPDPDNEPKCSACGRWLDDATGRPIKAQWLTCFTRAKPPSGWNPDEE